MIAVSERIRRVVLFTKDRMADPDDFLSIMKGWGDKPEVLYLEGEEMRMWLKLRACQELAFRKVQLRRTGYPDTLPDDVARWSLYLQREDLQFLGMSDADREVCAKILKGLCPPAEGGDTLFDHDWWNSFERVHPDWDEMWDASRRVLNADKLLRITRHPMSEEQAQFWRGIRAIEYPERLPSSTQEAVEVFDREAEGFDVAEVVAPLNILDAITKFSQFSKRGGIVVRARGGENFNGYEVVWGIKTVSSLV